ncbi:MAG: response regulator transcription factor [Acidobacteria bacterium]|nr:response regulator transcription factor [Acidobacteriota bacterium]
MSVRAIVVDDEPLARRRLRRLLKVHDDVEVVGEATNGDEAVSAALEAHPDVLFMDVRMPGSDGLQALRQLRDKLPADVMPLVIFTTAYEEHAVEAFELEGTDYLVKPVDKAALARALQRVRRGLWQRGRISRPADAESGATAVKVAAAPGTTVADENIGLAAHRAGKIIRLALADIACIIVDDTITWALTADGKFRLRQGLGQLEKRLSCPPFFRVSRAAMVNLRWIDHLAPMFSGTYSAFLREPVSLEIHISRRRARELRGLLGW